MTIESTGSIHFALTLKLLINPLFHHALKHSNASVRLSPRGFLSGVVNLLALLKARSHSQDVAGQANISKARRWRVGKASSPGYRIRLLSGGDSRTGGRISAEFVGDNVFLFPAVQPLFNGVSLLHLLVRGQGCVISFPNVPPISQYGLNPELELASLGIIEKVAPLCGIEESCGGIILFMSRLPRSVPSPATPHYIWPSWAPHQPGKSLSWLVRSTARIGP